MSPDTSSPTVVLVHGAWADGSSWSRVITGLHQAGIPVIAAPIAAPIELIPVWVRAGSIIVTYPADHVARGLGDVPESERPLQATLWGTPALGRTGVRLADGTRIAWHDGRWLAPPDREITFARHT